jgi:hypothetical protein
MFVRLRHKFCGETVDPYLRREWALANGNGKAFICDRCWSTFGDQRGLSELSHAPPKCWEQEKLYAINT